MFANPITFVFDCLWGLLGFCGIGCFFLKETNFTECLVVSFPLVCSCGMYFLLSKLFGLNSLFSIWGAGVILILFMFVANFLYICFSGEK